MLVENTQPRMIYVGGTKFIPGINQLSDSEFDRLRAGRYWTSLSRMSDEGFLKFIECDKPKVEQIKHCFDEEILKSWLGSAKGKMKKAIESQLKLVSIETEEG